MAKANPIRLAPAAAEPLAARPVLGANALTALFLASLLTGGPLLRRLGRAAVASPLISWAGTFLSEQGSCHGTQQQRHRDPGESSFQSHR